jgi:hypothetical protein
MMQKILIFKNGCKGTIRRHQLKHLDASKNKEGANTLRLQNPLIHRLI